MKETCGGIYILTNPSFPEYVKIGYADDVYGRLAELNRSECVPFAFRLFAYYKVGKRLTDIQVHSIIDRLNPNLRSIEEVSGKIRKREFYNMSASDALEILRSIAVINDLENNIVVVEPTAQEMKAEDEATEVRTRKSPTQYPKMDWLLEQKIINVGDSICVINHPEEVATLVDDSTVEYKGEKLGIQTWAKKITGWKAVQTYAMIRRVGDKKTLDELRSEKMKELDLI